MPLSQWVPVCPHRALYMRVTLCPTPPASGGKGKSPLLSDINALYLINRRYQRCFPTNTEGDIRTCDPGEAVPRARLKVVSFSGLYECAPPSRRASDNTSMKPRSRIKGHPLTVICGLSLGFCVSGGPNVRCVPANIRRSYNGNCYDTARQT